MTGGKLPTVELRLAPPDVRPHPEAETVWRAVRSVVEAMPEITPLPFEQWIKPLQVRGAMNGKLCLESTRYIASWARARYWAMLAELVRNEGTFGGLLIYDLPKARGAVL